MEKGKVKLTQKKAENTPAGGVVVGKRDGQTMIYDDASVGGYFIGKTHSKGGIKMINKSTGQPLEVQGSEVIITAPAVNDPKKHEFNGKMMTNRQILSEINQKGGGVAFAEKGMEIPKNIKRTGASYKYGGKTMTDHEIYKKITGGHIAEGMTLSQIAKMHKVSLKELQKQVDMGMKAESEHTSSKREQMKIVKDHLFENPKYYTLLKKVGLKHGGRVPKESLVRDAKSGNTPARDLNNYNDMLDVEADGEVGGDTGLFAKGGAVKPYDANMDGDSADMMFARGGATDVVVNNWSDIPDDFKNVRLPKQIDWSPNPSNDGLYEIVKPFLATDGISHAMQGINFDENGITATNAHILLTIPTKEHDFQGVYKPIKVTAKSLKQAFSEGFTEIFAKYPKYAQVIPTEIDITKVFQYVNIQKLLTYCKIASNYTKRDIAFRINNELMSFEINNIIGLLTSWIKLTGSNHSSVSFINDKRPLVFSENSIFELGKSKIALIMPSLMGGVKKLGARNQDKNAELNVYFDFDDNEIHNSDGSIVTDWQEKPKKERAKRTPKATPSQTSKQIDLLNKKIWIGDNPDLSRRVQEFGFANGFVNKANKEVVDTSNRNIYFVEKSDGTKYMYIFDYNKDDFDKETETEIFESDLFGTSSETPTTTSSLTEKELKLRREIKDFIKNWGWNLKKETSLIKDESTDYYQEFYTKEPYSIYTLTARRGVGLFPSDEKTLRMLEKLGFYDDYVEPTKAIPSESSKFTDAEIDVFKKIDDIQKENNFSEVDITEFKAGADTMFFVVNNFETGDVYSLRSFQNQLGIAHEDKSKEKTKDIIKKYLDWKISSFKETEKIVVFKLKGLSDDETQVSDFSVYGGTELLQHLKLLESKFPEREIFPYRIYDISDTPHGSINFGRGIKTLSDIEVEIIKSTIFDYYDWTNFINYGKEITSKPLITDLANTKIWINKDEDLAERVVKRAEELGWTDNSGIKNLIKYEAISGIIFHRNKYVGWVQSHEDFISMTSYKEIFESDLFGTEQTTTAEPVEQPKQSQTEKPKRNFELERKYLTQRISELAKELELKKPILSNEEVAFYQREINSFILKLRKLNDAEMSLKSIEERVRGVYGLKISALESEYPETDMVSINGLKSQLTEKEYFNVRTPEFKSFFGDWETAYLTDSYAGVSKVINPITKEPQPVFHGTNVLFVNWQTYETNNAHYFAVKREFSEFFATTWEERTDKAGVDSQILKRLNPNRGSFLMRCFIDVKNPIDFSRFGVEKYPVREFLTFLKVNYNIGDFDFWTNITSHSGVTQDTEVYAWQIIRLWQSFTKYIKVFTTYDGYIFYEYIPTKTYGGLENASLSYCAFDSNQIKFTDAYEFNALSNDSRFDLGGIL